MQYWVEPKLRSEYVKSGLGNLRCFPCCTESGTHRTNTFCGDSIKVRIQGNHPKSILLGKFRLADQIQSFEIGHTMDELVMQSNFLRAKFVGASRGETKFSFNPARRWDSTIRESGALVCFTMYLLEPITRTVQLVIHSDPFRIVTRDEDENGNNTSSATSVPAVSHNVTSQPKLAPPEPQEDVASPQLPQPHLSSTVPALPPVQAPAVYHFQNMMAPPPSVIFPQLHPSPTPPIPPAFHNPYFPQHAYHQQHMSPPPFNAPLLPTVAAAAPPHPPPPSSSIHYGATMQPGSYFLNPFQVNVEALRNAAAALALPNPSSFNSKRDEETIYREDSLNKRSRS